MSSLLQECFAGFLQFSVTAGSPAANLTRVREGLARLRPSSPGVVVLPELWATGFEYGQLPELARQTPALLAELQELAARYAIHLAGSLPEARNGLFHNTLYVTGPDGIAGSCRKQHLFAPMEEDRHFAPGNLPCPLDTPLGRLGGLVCYDLRFPELARWHATGGAGLLLVSAQWPAVRLDHWRTLVQARAIENQVFIVACNRCGITGETLFGGHSLVVGPDGTILAEAGTGEESAGLQLDPALLSLARSSFATSSATPYPHPDSAKIVSLTEAAAVRRRLKQLGRQVVFTNGCFDLLHVGHATYLEAARRQGDCLVVGLNSDGSVQRLKGPERPVNRQQDRARLLAALGCVDYVVLFEEDTPQQLIETLLPDVLVKGADWPVEEIVGGREVLAAGGRVANIPLVENFSTTALIERIKGAERE